MLQMQYNKSIVRDEWSKIIKAYLRALVASMPAARCAAVIATKGKHTKY